jgi:hypothetical protein
VAVAVTAPDELVRAACLVWRQGALVPPLDIRTRMAFDTVLAHVTKDFTPEQVAFVRRYVERVGAP